MTELPVAEAEAALPLDPVVAGVAKVNGQAMAKLPDDLYIPPDALQVFLEAFEGPLDLLLYLIRRQNLNILDIPVFAITQQYVRYIELMQGLKLELAAEYLVMAALLAEIKSRILLPRVVEAEDSSSDPRMDLVRRLQEYERFKLAAESIDALPRMGRELHGASAKPELVKLELPLPIPKLRELLLAFRDVLQRAALFSKHQVSREPLSVRARMTAVLARIKQGPCELMDLVDFGEGKAGVVVVLLAILELVKLAMLDLVQEGPFTPVLLAPMKARDVPDADPEDLARQASFE